ncbi:MAG: hypothetical protein AUF65_01245 [Chloroflexi bacterium 13_1_20CM_50_12]|nr:MAG: hypothetical protein AUF65_01245 [Chloroflexi bacterium 13_1_20CM_50_12]
MKADLFAVSLAAFNKDKNATDHVAAFCTSDAKDEARKWAMDECLKHFPVADGWENHGISIGLIPRDAYR